MNGTAYGLGCGIALFCDIRIAGESASFSEAFIRNGLVTGDGSAWLLPRLIGMANTLWMQYTGDPVRAHTVGGWITANPGSATSSTWSGVTGVATIPDTNSVALNSAVIVGVDGSTYYNGTGSLWSAIGTSGGSGNSGSGTLTQATGVDGNLMFSEGGTTSYAYGVHSSTIFLGANVLTYVDKLYGFYAANPTGTGANGTIGTNYGLYIANQTAGTANYSIYSAGGANYFTGNVTTAGTFTNRLRHLRHRHRRGLAERQRHRRREQDFHARQHRR